MLLHTCTNILVKKLFGNDLVRRFSYLSLTNRGGQIIRFPDVVSLSYLANTPTFGDIGQRPPTWLTIKERIRICFYHVII